MKLLLPSIGLMVILAFAFDEENNRIMVADRMARNIVSCSPDRDYINGLIEEVDIPLMPGSGIYKWKLTTSSDSAQLYFNQGINMYYSFHIIEAMASFRKAAKFDPGEAMLQWAIALSFGPNINDVGYAQSPEAITVLEKAVSLSVNSSAKEKALIAAQRTRYSNDSSVSRATLNQAYADAMKNLYQQYPDDADIAAIYADALMLQHPWDLWRNDGTPKPWTPEIRAVLEKLLATTPDHPGANHYYIHVMEPSPYADRAIPSADRLGRLTPGLSHTVHMPSHIYLRTGNYDKGVKVNETAVAGYKQYLTLFSPVKSNDFLYLIHNLHMQTNNAMLGGRSGYSVKVAGETRESIPADYLLIPGAMGNFLQYVYMTPVFVDVRFARWKALLESIAPDSKMVYASVLHHFGRGMALANTGKTIEAKNELEQVRTLMKDSVLMLPFTPFSAAIEGSTVAEHLLAGTIAMRERNFSAAIEHFTSAVSVEANMVYTEPRDWILNPGHYLGDAYLKAGQFADAEVAYLKDLENNRDNIWALTGLYQALSGQKKNAAAAKLKMKLDKIKGKGDVKLSGSIL